MHFKKNLFPVKLKEKLTLYGWRITLLIVTKTMIRKLTGFSCEKYCLMARGTENLPPIEEGKFVVRELSIHNYENELWESSFLDKEKKQIYIKRFANSNAKAYGAFVDGQLAYSTWILYGEVIIQNSFRFKTSDKTALLLDTYSHPNFRGIGLHNYMNLWRLYEMQRRGVKTAVGVVWAYNRPAMKTQFKCGLSIAKYFYIIRFRHKKWCTMKQMPL